MCKPASPVPEAVAKTPTVGETMFAALCARGEKTTQQLRDALVTGWAGWEQWHLSSKQVDDLFAGKCDEAEEVSAMPFLAPRGFRCTTRTPRVSET